ncbi:bifunctional ADP-dependent NAD(P)H-hydrate dehydratase/NAD(P)H-hydrate epimerase [[Limnothrix rosea] IAM M-220]|uniref:bifunctional ADP-dependent NAD(P)H-hydrate dehydratase/NAD(P)H-hydrate epimerase n=1 Tax=[Limnothrix rosea] IAM M-220 TaxID=454133 RepID=UPI0009631BBA|nr:bifunctional ADP-dependent NAD(P)H-hydrate dehydratase/NAD(P)H-hydrate epimerase [[Limnothrix rosea] IAM M-220]OKH15166.1 bifunctional ADP-dependent (S)-NAD(P)H-hydrate dehydratase/NAD(P)H-hydrate epimerase [[Limnothrix rosea] IAM M-220]
MFDTDNIIVSAEEMRQIEAAIFEQGMPVAALMEKAATLIFHYIQSQYPRAQYPTIGVLVGPGHNGGDALVVARELYFAGYEVLLYRPLAKLKPLTKKHFDYAHFLKIFCTPNFEKFLDCDVIIDGLFGFGLEREITENLALLIEQLNEAEKVVISIDLPSGLHTDTGKVLGTAVQATESLCLGLWKRLYTQDEAIPYIGEATRLDFGMPPQILQDVLPLDINLQRMTTAIAQSFLPLARSPLTYKYQQGHLLLIGGSAQYAGSVILAALGARAAGMGMVTIAVPESLKNVVVAQLPEALVIDCPESHEGVITRLPTLDFSKYQAIACGCGLTLTGANNILPDLVPREIPLILDADALNWLAEDDLELIQHRHAPTILTPHLGEFRRLFADQIPIGGDRLNMTQKAAKLSQAITLLKGANTIISRPNGQTYCVTESTPALARGGSGDVLLGLIGGLLAQMPDTPLEITATAAWWHAQAGILAAKEQTLAGVDGVTLATYLTKFLAAMVANS